MSSIDVATRALARWATEEGEPEVQRFCQVHMGMSVGAVARALVERRPVATSFDVIAFLFPGAGGGRASAGTPRTTSSFAIPESEVTEQRPVMHPRTPARVLISVMVADGELRPGEIKFIQDFLTAEGLGPLEDADLRIWRPQELGTPPDHELRARLVEATVHLMHLDRERDGSEWKVVRSFAGAWGITEDQLKAWDKAYDARYATTMTRLWAALSKLVRLR